MHLNIESIIIRFTIALLISNHHLFFYPLFYARFFCEVNQALVSRFKMNGITPVARTPFFHHTDIFSVANVYGVIQPLRGQNFAIFGPPPLRGQFLYPERGQKQRFFDPLPP